MLFIFCVLVFFFSFQNTVMAAVNRPLGTLIWTDFDGDWKVKFHTFHHPDLDEVPSLKMEGTVTYGDEDNPGNTAENPPYIEFSGATEATDFLHPVFDYTGVRLFFASGKGITHSGSGDEMTLQQPETKIWKYSKTAPPASPFVEYSGWDYAFHPVCDHKGQFVLFNKFQMKDDGGVPPGIHLYRADYSDGGNVKLVCEHAAYPAVAASDNLIVFVRQLPNTENLPETPIAMGVYSLEIDPATGESAGNDPVLLTPGLGDGFDGYVDVSKNPNPVWRGPIRCGKAAIANDGDTIIFSLQDGRFGTTNPTWNLWKLNISSGDMDSIHGVNDDDLATDDYWPSVSADGKWVAHMNCIKGSSDVPAKYKIIVTCIDNPTTNVQPDNLGPKAMWPCFDQDNDVPNIEIRLTPGRSGKATSIRITDIEPDEWDSGTCKDKFKMHFKGSNFVPGGSVDFTPATTLELTWEKNDLPAKLNLLLSTNAVYEGDHKSYKSFTGFTADYENAGGNPIEAMYLEEGSRLKIDILARDGRYLRPDSGDNNPEDFKWDSKAASYHDLSFESLHSIDSGRNVDPPYFPRIAKKALDENYPGLAWWVVEPDGTVARGSESALYYIFRRPNFPPAHPDYDAEKPYFIRVVAQDIWLNRIDLKIPVYIWDKKSDVQSLGFKSNKRR